MAVQYSLSEHERDSRDLKRLRLRDEGKKAAEIAEIEGVDKRAVQSGLYTIDRDYRRSEEG